MINHKSLKCFAIKPLTVTQENIEFLCLLYFYKLKKNHSIMSDNSLFNIELYRSLESYLDPRLTFQQIVEQRQQF